MKRGLVRPHGTVDDMVFISQPAGRSLADMDHTFSYDSTAGAGHVVYILDFGVDIDIPVGQLSNTLLDRDLQVYINHR